MVKLCWLWNAGLLTVAIAATATALLGPWSAAMIVGGVGISLLALILPLLFPYVGLLLRTGRFVATVSHKRLQQLIEADDAVFVGEGWSFWLGYTRPAAGRVVSMSRSYAGIVDLQRSTVTVRSGTRLGDLKRVLAKHGKTLIDRSQFDDMTVGGALRTSAHGFHTNEWFVSTLVEALVAVRGTTKQEVIRANKARLLDPRVVILHAKFRIVDNEARTLVNREWKTEDDVALDEYDRSDYRMIFIRRRFVNAKYLLARDQTADDVALPLRGQFVRQQMLRCARDYRCPTTVADAQSFVQYLDFVEALSIRCLSYLNAELFVRTPLSTSTLVRRLLRFHNEHGGRTEIRERGSGGSRVVALDIAFSGAGARAMISKYLEYARTSCAVQEVAMHGGKYQLDSTHPLRLVSNIDFFHARATP